MWNFCPRFTTNHLHSFQEIISLFFTSTFASLNENSNSLFYPLTGMLYKIKHSMIIDELAL